MSTPREVYETLVGVNSGMGVGEFKDALNKLIAEHTDGESGQVDEVNEERTEEFLRELVELIANEDDFDQAPMKDDLGNEDDLGPGPAEDYEGPDEEIGLLPGESFEQIPGEDEDEG